MKTNHQRQFKETRTSRDVFAKYMVGNFSKIAFGGHIIGAGSTSGDHCCGKRGIRRDKAGAKKFVNSRERFHSNQHLKKIAGETYED